MAKKREGPRRPADRKPALGGNLVWPLVAAGVASLFALSLVSVTPELSLSYSDLERLRDNDPVLPIPTTQRMNACLKELAVCCEINKELTFHIARHTFATTVTMTNGVPIESVSKMLGHTNIKSTQHYAKIVDKKVGDDMAALAQKLNLKLVTTTR